MERGKPAPVQVDDFAAALKTDESRRTFWMVEGDDELRRMLDEPLEFWRVFLHPSQRKLVERTWNGPVLVRGGAGTGKTVVAMHRARWLSDLLGTRNDPNGKVLFTTFTSNLAADVQENLVNLCSKEQLACVEVKHLDGWVVEFLKRAGYDKEIVYLDDEGKLEEAWSQAYNSFGEGLGLSFDFLKDEWRREWSRPNAVRPPRLPPRAANRPGYADRPEDQGEESGPSSPPTVRGSTRRLVEPDDAYRDARAILREKPALLYPTGPSWSTRRKT